MYTFGEDGALALVITPRDLVCKPTNELMAYLSVTSAIHRIWFIYWLTETMRASLGAIVLYYYHVILIFRTCIIYSTILQ